MNVKNQEEAALENILADPRFQSRAQRINFQLGAKKAVHKINSYKQDRLNNQAMETQDMTAFNLMQQVMAEKYGFVPPEEYNEYK